MRNGMAPNNSQGKSGTANFLDGGGKVAGFQGKNIVLVEDEDGFEIPMPINEVVVVALLLCKIF